METTKTWTEKMIMSIPKDGHKHELINGEFTMVPAGFEHEVINTRLIAVLAKFVYENKLGFVCARSGLLDEVRQSSMPRYILHKQGAVTEIQQTTKRFL